jgi:hypothetical protein
MWALSVATLTDCDKRVTDMHQILRQCRRRRQHSTDTGVPALTRSPRKRYAIEQTG